MGMFAGKKAVWNLQMILVWCVTFYDFIIFTIISKFNFIMISSLLRTRQIAKKLMRWLHPYLFRTLFVLISSNAIYIPNGSSGRQVKYESAWFLLMAWCLSPGHLQPSCWRTPSLASQKSSSITPALNYDKWCILHPRHADGIFVRRVLIWPLLNTTLSGHHRQYVLNSYHNIPLVLAGASNKPIMTLNARGIFGSHKFVLQMSGGSRQFSFNYGPAIWAKMSRMGWFVVLIYRLHWESSVCRKAVVRFWQTLSQMSRPAWRQDL